MKPFLILALVISCAKPQPPSTPPMGGPLSPTAYAHYLRGQLAVQASNYPAAVLQFRAAAAAARSEPHIRVALVQALLSAHQYATARNASLRAQKRFPSQSAVWLVGGRAYRASNKLTEATRMLKRAIKLDADNEAAYLVLAKVWRARGRPGLVTRTYRRLLRRKPSSIEANYHLGMHLLRRGKFAQVAPLLRRVIADNPDHLQAWVALARSQRARGHTGSARKSLQRAFDRSNGDVAVADELFRQLLDTSSRRFAVTMLLSIDRSDLNADTRISIGYLLLHAGAATAALKLANAIGRQSVRGETHILKATALTHLNREQAALTMLLSVASRDTTYAQARAQAVELLARRGEFKRAVAVAGKALIKHGRHIDLIVAHALTLELSGDVKGARQVLQTALAAQPKNAELRLSFGAMEERQRQPDQAVKLVMPVLADNPNDTRALNFIAYSLADRGIQFRRADRMLRKAIRLAPTDGYIIDSYGWLQFRRRKLDAAHKLLARAVRLAPAEPEILWHLAELYLYRKQQTQALRLLTRAQKLRPIGRVKRRIEARIQALRAD